MGALSKNTIDFDFCGIGTILLNNQFQVPVFQRPYSWEEKQVKELFYDIKTAALTDKSEVYFLGTIVTTYNEDYLDVIDGQQRLATITILLAVIRDYFYKVEDKDRVDHITSKYLQSKDLVTKEILPKLKLNESDNDYFCNYILRNPDDTARKTVATTYSSNQKIEKAFILLQEEVRVLLQESDDEDLIKIIQFIHSKLSIVHISVYDDSNAFTIFETLNDRGLSLAISDLLKNYLFGLAGERLNEVQANWIAMFSMLETQEDKKIIIEFLRHYFSAKYHLVREKDLYQAIKNQIKSKGQAVSFAKELNDNSKKYIGILQSDNDLWKGYTSETIECIRNLNKLGFVQVRPLLLAVVSNFTIPNVQKAVKMILSITVRLLVVGTSGSGAIEENYCRTAQKIYNKVITKVSELKTELKPIVPSNAVFKNAFKVSTISKHYIARYYLLEIENFLRKTENDELFPSSDEGKLNLEHILPQKIDEKWSNFTEDTHKAFYKRLGNMTLLATKINSDLKSEAYSEKKIVLGKSKLILNDYFREIDIWNASQIEQRQEYLSEQAISVWKV